MRKWWSNFEIKRSRSLRTKM